jgi:hypothetical protein
MARSSHPPQLDYSNYTRTWRRVQITKLLVMQFDIVHNKKLPRCNRALPSNKGVCTVSTDESVSREAA